MKAVGWAQAEQHAQTPSHVTLDTVRAIANEVWSELSSACDMRDNVRIDVFLDVTQRGVLAFTRRTLLLMDGNWKPSTMFDYGGVDIEVHFNPNVPNGWYVGGACDTGWRYDLRTVMRHEMLHGAGLSTGIRHSASATSVGYNAVGTGACYPVFYDTRLESGGVPIIDGCTYIGGSGAVYMAGRKIFVPDQYRAGSSYSHYDEDGLFRWQLGPSQCHPFDTAEYDMLDELGYNCTRGRHMLSSGQKLNANADILLLFVLFVMSCTASKSFRLSCLWSSLIASLACWYLHNM